MSDTAQMELVSTGELARRLGRSISGVRKLERQGRIPKSATIVGNGRKVWRLADLPAIEQALQEDSSRNDRAAVA